jgi:hypothetical protein
MSNKIWLVAVLALVVLSTMCMPLANAAEEGSQESSNPFTCEYTARTCYDQTDESCQDKDIDYEGDMGNCFMSLVWTFTIGILLNHPLLCLYIVLALVGILVLLVIAGVMGGLVYRAATQ